MKRNILIVVLLLIIAIAIQGSGQYVFAAGENNKAQTLVLCINSPKSLVDNKLVNIDASDNSIVPLIKNSKTLIPVRYVSETLGALVDWNPNTNCITITLENKVVQLTIGSNVLTLNGNASTLVTPAEIINGKTYVPLRAVIEALGKEVSYSKGIITIGNPEFIGSLTDDSIDNYLIQLTTDDDLAVQTKARQIIRLVIKPGMTDLEKEFALHDYIVFHYKYDEKLAAISQTPYGLLINGTGVCQAYADSMKLLLDMVGIESHVVTGTVSVFGKKSGHAWNIVKINGSYYHLDATWDDPVPDWGDVVMHDYFNLSDDVIGITHDWNKSLFPKCSNNSFSYLRTFPERKLPYTTQKVDNWFYYINESDKNSLYRINIDGTKNEKLSDDNVYAIYNSKNGWIYYHADGKVYRINYDGTGKKLLTSDTINILEPKDEWIYYFNYSDNSSIYRMKDDGTSRQKILEDRTPNLFLSDETWIYYCNYSDNSKLYKIKNDGSVKVKLTDDSMSIDTRINNYWFEGDWIVFYKKTSSGEELYKIKKDGTDCRPYN